MFIGGGIGRHSQARCKAVTESATTTHPEDAVKVLQRLYEWGIQVAMDNFGTDHSLLSMLRTLPFNERRQATYAFLICAEGALRSLLPIINSRSASRRT